jgi:hypothetical protein
VAAVYRAVILAVADGHKGDAHLPVDKRTTHTNIKRLPNAWSTPMAELPSAKYGLLPSGLLGPVEIRLE